jgi:hypothetical protein
VLAWFQGSQPQLQGAQPQLISATTAGGNVVNVANATPQQQQLLLAYQQQRRTLGNLSNTAAGTIPTQVMLVFCSARNVISPQHVTSLITFFYCYFT